MMKTRNPPFSNARRLKKRFSNGDTISNLPDSILHLILSFLTMKQVVQTSVLSSRWRCLWTSLPTLKFDSTEFCFSRISHLDRFKGFIDKVLLLRDNSNLKRFHLTSKCDCDVTHCLNTWILVALRRNVQELALDISVNDVDQISPLPHSLFNSKSLTTLTLQMGVRDYKEIVLPDTMCLPALKSLHLKSFKFRIEYSTNNLLSSCAVLESLVISDCKFSIMNLTISSPNLKYLDIDLFRWGFAYTPRVSGKIKLYAPNLTWLRCNDYIGKEYSLESLYSLTHADIHMGREDDEEDDALEEGMEELRAQRMITSFRALHNVKDLRLTGSFLQLISGFPELLKSQPVQFCNLRCLALTTCLSRDVTDAILYFLKSAPNLETLSLVVYQQNVQEPPVYTYLDKVNYWESGLPLECLLCPLKSVEIHGVIGSINEFRFLEVLLMNVMALEKLVVHTCKKDTPARQLWLKCFGEKLLALPRASSSVEVRHVRGCVNELGNFAEECRGLGENVSFQFQRLMSSHRDTRLIKSSEVFQKPLQVSQYGSSLAR